MIAGERDARIQVVNPGVWSMRVLAALALYVLVAGGLSPGFITIGAPLHSDVFRYFEIAHGPASWGVLTNPRPLMLVALRVLDIADFRLFYAALLVAPIVLPLFMLGALERARGIAIGWSAVIPYLALCYVLPSFYELAPLDFGGALAGIVACFAAIVLCGGSGRIRLLAYLGLTWASLEFKPTYAFVLCLLPLLVTYGRAQRREGLAASVGAFAVALGVFLKDRWLGSAFVGVGAQSGGSYQLLGQPGVIFEALGFYVQRLFSPMGWVLVVACAVWLWRSRHHREVVAIAMLAGAALLPMLLIPNHRFVMYAWYASSILLLLVPLAAMRIPVDGHGRTAGIVVLSAMVLMACLGESRFLPSHRGWYVHNQQVNANVLASLDELKGHVLPGDRLLISGRLAPYIPFKNDGFMARYLPKGTHWTVVTPPSEDALIATSTDTRRYVQMAAIDGSQFDRHVEYGADGRIDRIGVPDPALGSNGDTPLRRELLFCSPAIADAASKSACLAELR